MCKLTVGATEEDFNYDFDDYDDIDFGTHRKLQGWLSLASNSPSMWAHCWHCTGGSGRGAPLQDDYAAGDESEGGDDYARGNGDDDGDDDDDDGDDGDDGDDDDDD